MRVRAICAALACVSSAWALEVPAAVGRDGRIRYVGYDQDEVVSITAVVGVVTHIVFEPGEKYVTHAFGDGKAWDLAVKEHHVFVKAVALDADSNLTIVTDRRSYHFTLKLAATAGAEVTYEVRFEYPRKRADAARKKAVEEGFAKRPADANLKYTMSGDTDIAPLNVWDDKTFTYFKFPGNRDLPAIYMVDAEGSESIVNRHSAGAANELVVVHRVAPRWVLRLGSRALGVWNDAYDASGRENATRTASPEVKRTLWR